MSKRKLEQRVIYAAEQTLERQHYVTDVLLDIGFLQFSHLENWRRGKITYLEKAVQANLATCGTQGTFSLG